MMPLPPEDWPTEMVPDITVPTNGNRVASASIEESLSEEVTIPNADLKQASRKSPSNLEAFNPDRLPPHSPEFELGIIGCIMLQPDPCLDEAIELIQGRSEVFYDLRLRKIFDHLCAMSSIGVPIDTISIIDWIRDKGDLEMVGGMSFLAGLPDRVPSAANLSYYANIVYEKYLLRQMIQVCTTSIGKMYDNTGEIEALVDSVESQILQVRIAQKDSNRTIRDDVVEVMDIIERNINREGSISGIPTGFSDLDRITSGLHQGDMIVLAARPSLGKTSLAMNIAEYVAVEQKMPVGVFSLEMSRQSLVHRMICSRSRVNVRGINGGFISAGDKLKLERAAAAISAAPIIIDDAGGISIAQLRAKARRMYQKNKIKLFIVDYLQLMHGTSRKSDQSRVNEITEISNGIKNIAKELNIPVIAISQLNRDLEKDTNRKPRMSDLRDSGSIEQDADVIALIYRPKTNGDPQPDSDIIQTKLSIAKQRNGPTVDVELTFFRNFTRFESTAKITPDDIPNPNQRELNEVSQ